MKCQGRPDGKCPDNRNDNTVHNTVGDIFLCYACEEFRWPSVSTRATRKTAPAPAAAGKAPRKQASNKSDVNRPVKTPVHTPSTPSSPPSSVQKFDSASKISTQSDTYVTATTCSVCMMSAVDETACCDICEAVCHISCLPVPQKLREPLQKLLSIIGWVCDSCRASARSNLHKLQSALSHLTQEVAHLQQQIKNLTVPASASSNDGNMIDRNPENTDEVPKNNGSVNVQRMVHRTLEDLQLRKSNVVVTGLPETGDAESDHKQFTDFCTEHLLLKPCVTGCFRLGREMSDRPRRLLVKLRTEQSVDELLRDARKLRTSPDPLAKSVFLNSDLSPQQRQLAFEARCRKRQKSLTPRQGVPITTSGTAEITPMNTVSSHPSMDSQLPAAATATTTGACGTDQDMLSSSTSNPSSSAISSQPYDQPEPTASSNRFP